MRCPHPETAARMIERIKAVRAEGDSVGGVIECRIRNVPAGLGEPVFDRLEADLGKAMLSLPATKGFEIGSGFGGSLLRGSEHNDLFESHDGRVRTKTNRSGGVQGGISNGEEIVFRDAALSCVVAAFLFRWFWSVVVKAFIEAAHLRRQQAAQSAKAGGEEASPEPGTPAAQP